MTHGYRFQHVEIGELVQIASGQISPLDSDYADLPHIGPENLRVGGGIVHSSIRTARELGLVSGKYFFDRTSILYSKIRPALNKVGLPGFSGICSADMYPMWVRDASTTDREYVYHALTSEAFVDSAAGRSFRTGIPKINRDDLDSLTLPVPPLPEQRRIAEVLSTWDDAIELAEAQITALRMRRDWLRMEVLTGRARMDNYSAPWIKMPLRGVLREHKQRSSGSEDVFSVSVHKGLVNQKEHLGRSFAAANTDHYNLVKPGDIVYTKSPTGDFPLGIIKRSAAPVAVIVSPLYGVFTPQSPDLGVILDAYFESPRSIQNYLSPLVQKGAKNTISITNQGFLGGHLTLPVDTEEQSYLATILTASREEIAAAQRKAELLRTQKRGLMQKLLTGQVRVNVAADIEPGGQDIE